MSFNNNNRNNAHSISLKRKLDYVAQGFGSLYVSNGLLLAVIQNHKTRSQLTSKNLSCVSPSFFPHYGHLESYLIELLKKYVTAPLVSSFLERKLQVPRLVADLGGCIVGGIVVYPISTIRTNQALYYDSRPYWKNLFNNVQNKGIIRGLFLDGADISVGIGFGLYLTQSVLSFVLLRVFDRIFASLSPSTLHSAWGRRIILFSLSAIVLNPLDVMVKRLQTNQEKDKNLKLVLLGGDEKQTMWKSLVGLYRGALWSIPEAFSIVVVTHLVHEALEFEFLFPKK